MDRRLYHACSKGNKESIQKVLNCNSVKYVDPTLGDTPLHHACKQGWLDIVRVLTEKYDHCDLTVTVNYYNQSPLHYACQHGNIDVVEYLISEQHLNPLLKDYIELEPLDYALDFGNIDVATYICKHCISSDEMISINRIKTIVHLIKSVDLSDPIWTTADGDNILQLLTNSRLCISHMSSAVVLRILLLNISVGNKATFQADWRTGDGDNLLEVACQSEVYLLQITSACLLKWLEVATIGLVKTSIPDSKTADGKFLIQLVCKSKMCVSHISTIVLSRWISDTTFDLEKVIVAPEWKTANGDTLLEIICLSEVCISKTSSIQILKWLNNTTLDISTLDSKWMSADGDSILELVCQSKICLSRISSVQLLKWLSVNILYHVGTSLPDTKTADGDKLLKLVCKSENSVSQISSAVLSKWLRDTTLDLVQIIVSWWRTADGDTLLELVCQSKTCLSRISSALFLEWLLTTTIYHVDISLPDSKTADGIALLKLVCCSETSVLRISSAVFSQWLRDTTFDLAEIVVPEWMTANNDTLLQLVCQSETCLSRISSIVLLKWLHITTLNYMSITLLDSRTADGDTFLQLVCRSQTAVLHISSAVFSEWLINTTSDLAEIIIPKWKTADGDNLLQLVCQSKVCLSRISSAVLLKWLCTTILYRMDMSLPDSKTADGEILLQLVCQSEFNVSRISSVVLSKWLRDTVEVSIAEIIIPMWKTASGDTLLQLVCQCEVCLSGIPSAILLHWLHITTLSHCDEFLPDSKTADGDTLLQLILQSAVCVSHISSIALSQLLSSSSEISADQLGMVDPKWKTLDGVCFFHTLCQCKLKNGNAVELLRHYIIQKKAVNPDVLDSSGNTALHISCKHNKPTLVAFLLNEAQCDPTITNKMGNLALDMAVNPEVVNYFCQYEQSIIYPKTIAGWISNKEIDNTEMMNILKVLVRCKSVIVGSTLLHLICKCSSRGHMFDSKVIHYLLTEGCSDPNQLDIEGQIPLQLTSDSRIMRKLVEHGANITKDVVFKVISSNFITDCTASELFTLSTRKRTMLWNPDDRNSDGFTALHLACKADRSIIVNFLLTVAHCDPNISSSNKEIPLQMTTNPQIIKNLIRHGAKTSIMYKSYEKDLGTSKPVQPPVKIFVVGNSSVGKSTLTAALQKRIGFVARLFFSGRVSDVDKNTVGIVPHDLDSDIFGRVTFYDFAGHREFYSSHAALLQTAIQSTPPIFLLVVNLCEEGNKIIKDILFWISFLENQCASVSCKPHVILVGSHADILKDILPKDKVKKIVDSLDSMYFTNVQRIGFVAMNCQYHESSGMNELRHLLTKSIDELRIHEPITFNAHCFLVFLIDTIMNLTAVTIKAVSEIIENQLSTGVLEFLPKVTEALYKICLELNDRGHILLLKDRISAENSYIIIDKEFLLSKISGTVFAPEGFKQHKQLSTNTGVVPLSNIAKSFPGYHLDILIGFLTHLEFCHEISDQALHHLISEQYSQIPGERYYLFPGLISLTADDTVWQMKSKYDHYFGWNLKCTYLEQFFNSRFLQVLLLRLAFSFALETSHDNPNQSIGIHRKCYIWKNGIFWGNVFGMQTLVEITSDNKSVILLVRFRKANFLQCIHHRSEVISIILQCKEQFCPKIIVSESFVDSSSPLKYPLNLTDELNICSIQDLATAVVSDCECPSVVLQCNTIPAEHFLSFEPYLVIKLSAIQTLLNEKEEKEVISEKFLSIIAQQASEELTTFIEAVVGNTTCSLKGDQLYQSLIKWRDDDMDNQKTYCDLRQLLDQYSVFAGRNILKLAKLENLPSSQLRDPEGEGKEVPKLIVQGNGPRIYELQMLELSDGRVLRIMESVAPHWKQMAVALGFSVTRIRSIEKGVHYKPDDASFEIFSCWLEGEHNLKPPTWNVLIQCLKQANLLDVADMLTVIQIDKDYGVDGAKTTCIQKQVETLRNEAEKSDFEVPTHKQ